MEHKILIIDDEEAVRNVLSVFLDKHDFSVRAVESGWEGLAALEEEGFDLVLLDMCLPDGDGLELIDRMREARPTAAIVVLTGLEVDEELVELAKQSGAIDCISKLVLFRDLINKLNSILFGRRTGMVGRVGQGHVSDVGERRGTFEGSRIASVDQQTEETDLNFVI